MEFSAIENPDGNYLATVSDTAMGLKSVLPITGRLLASKQFGTGVGLLKTGVANYNALLTKSTDTANRKGINEMAARADVIRHVGVPTVSLINGGRDRGLALNNWMLGASKPYFPDGEANRPHRTQVAHAILTSMKPPQVVELAIRNPEIGAALVEAGETFALAHGFPKDLYSHLLNEFTEGNLARTLAAKDAKYKLGPIYSDVFRNDIDWGTAKIDARAAIAENKANMAEVDNLRDMIGGVINFCAVAIGSGPETAFGAITASVGPL